MPSTDPVGAALEFVVTWGTLAVVGLFLWPPGRPYWDGLAAVVGETPTLAVAVGLAAGAGAWYARTTGFGPVPVLLGTGAAYATGVVAMVAWLGGPTPESLALSGLLAGAVVCGATCWWVGGTLSR